MCSSFILTPDYFKLPENGALVRESGIENRYNRALEMSDPHFQVNKDDWSDGVIRYIVDDEVKFYGIQECKRLASVNSLWERITQALVYVHDWITKFPKIKNKFKVLILPTEKFIDILYIEDLLKSSFWTEFSFYYSLHKDSKGSASNFYKKSADIRALIMDYKNRLKGSHRVINKKLDYKEITEEILHNCL